MLIRMVLRKFRAYIKCYALNIIFSLEKALAIPTVTRRATTRLLTMEKPNWSPVSSLVMMFCMDRALPYIGIIYMVSGLVVWLENIVISPAIRTTI